MAQEKDIWTVTRLNQTAQGLLEQQLGTLWLEGELSNFKSYASGHWYFSLKDSKSEVRCVMFRGSNSRVTFRPEDGQQLRVRAKVTLYPPRGGFQLQVLNMQEAGAGNLLAQLEQLKQKLKAEGLFAAERKKPLPRLPRQLGVITSASGAALHDITRVLKRRCPQLPVVLYPASVQGKAAPSELQKALELAIARRECDVLIIGRGGGSLEDLFCFNDEALVRAIAACPVPIVSAVGHEVDYSLSDFVADARAATPSAAAEVVCPDMAAWAQQRQQLHQRLQLAITRQLDNTRQKISSLHRRLLSPERALQQQQQRLDELQNRLTNGWQWQQQAQRQRLRHLQQRLQAYRPDTQLAQYRQRCQQLEQQLLRSMQHVLDATRQRITPLTHRLQMASPNNLLERGYSLTFLAQNGTLINADTPLPAGTSLMTKFAGGRQVESTVDKTS